MGVNFQVAICAGYAGATIFSVLSANFIRESSKTFIKNLVKSLIGYSILGYITVLFL